MLWVALFCPTLPLDRIQRRLPESLMVPLAVCQTHGNKRCIDLANPAACTLGVRAGQPIATALAVCPQIMLFEHDAADTHQALHEAALASLRYTPSVHVRDHGLLLEISASVRLFGGRQKLLRQIQTTLHDLGLAPAIGVASSAHGAWLLACSVAPKQAAIAPLHQLAQCLDRLPLKLLESSADHISVLEGIGCTSIGDLRRLPRAGLARRFGMALLNEIDRAYMHRDEPQQWFLAPLRFHQKLELIARVDSTDALVFAAKRLMTQLAGWLSARHAAISRLTLSLHHERWRPSDQAISNITIHLSQPNRDPEHLLGLIRERLGQMVLSSPVEELSLSAEEVSSAQIEHEELFPTVQSTAVSLHRLIEKLTARLGHDAVSRVSSTADHRPEKAWHRASIGAPVARAGQPLAIARPSWLMQQPVALTVQHNRPVYGSTLNLLCGPERIESGWWDDGLIERDYYIAENSLGQLLWVYRQRHPSDTGAQWYLHGLFG